MFNGYHMSHVVELVDTVDRVYTLGVEVLRRPWRIDERHIQRHMQNITHGHTNLVAWSFDNCQCPKCGLTTQPGEASQVPAKQPATKKRQICGGMSAIMLVIEKIRCYSLLPLRQPSKYDLSWRTVIFILLLSIINLDNSSPRIQSSWNGVSFYENRFTHDIEAKTMSSIIFRIRGLAINLQLLLVILVSLQNTYVLFC